MKHLKISNEGLIDHRALTLLGASTKRDDDTKIGYFGSGNKYAIAYFLRNNMNFRIFSGMNEIKVGKIQEKFRDRSFEVVIINGDMTSITTETGPQWELWQAVREIISNAIDEGGFNMEIVEEIEPDSKITSFYIEVTEDIRWLYNNRDKYFTHDREPLFSCKELTLYDKYDEKYSTVFRKGIKCFNDEFGGVFDYDINEVEINEERLASLYEIEASIRVFYLLYAKKEHLLRLFDVICEEDSLEGGISWYTWDKVSVEWKLAIGKRVLVPDNLAGFYDDVKDPLYLPESLIVALERAFPDDIITVRNKSGFLKPYKPTEIEMSKYNSVRAFFVEAGYEFNRKVEFVAFSDSNCLGSVAPDKTTVLLGKRAFIEGKDMIAKTLMEEDMHIESEYADKTRSFQDYIITQFLNYMQKESRLEL